MEFILQNLDILLLLLPVTLGYASGTWVEKHHYKSIIRREKKLIKMVVITTEASFPDGKVSESDLVVGSVVVSIDYFKRLLAILRNFFGGRVKSYESLVDRARREAVLRMKEAARKQGASIIVNMRLETSTIGNSANRKSQVGSVEAIAYGTAVTVNR